MDCRNVSLICVRVILYVRMLDTECVNAQFNQPEGFDDLVM